MKNKQHRYWLLAALFAPLAHFAGCGWLTVALTAAAVLPLTKVAKSWEGIGKPLAVIQLLWLGAVAGALLTESAAYWPSDNTLAVPLTILALAAWTGTAAAPRTGAVAAFCSHGHCAKLNISCLVIVSLHTAGSQAKIPQPGNTAGLFGIGAAHKGGIMGGDKYRCKERIQNDADNDDLFDFSLGEFTETGFTLEDVTRDLHNSEWDKDNIRTEFEQKFADQGIPIKRVVARM